MFSEKKRRKLILKLLKTEVKLKCLSILTVTCFLVCFFNLEFWSHDFTTSDNKIHS